MKTCLICGVEKNTKQCKVCRNAKAKERRAKLREERMEKNRVEDLEGEQWQDIEAYEGLYKVSNKGRVKTVPRVGSYEKLLKLSQYGNQYLRVSLYNKEGSRKYYVHRLVGAQFVQKDPEKIIIDHVDRNKHNNNAENLRWSTYSENNKNREVVGGILDRYYKLKSGEKRLKGYQVEYTPLDQPRIKKYFAKKEREEAEAYLKELQEKFKR